MISNINQIAHFCKISRVQFVHDNSIIKHISYGNMQPWSSYHGFDDVLELA